EDVAPKLVVVEVVFVLERRRVAKGADGLQNDAATARRPRRDAPFEILDVDVLDALELESSDLGRFVFVLLGAQWKADRQQARQREHQATHNAWCLSKA